MRYSLPLDKEVSRKELFDHLYTPGKWANDQKMPLHMLLNFMSETGDFVVQMSKNHA